MSNIAKEEDGGKGALTEIMALIGVVKEEAEEATTDPVIKKELDTVKKEIKTEPGGASTVSKSDISKDSSSAKVVGT